MTSKATTPTIEQIDRLRAGLLDHDPDLKQRIVTALENNPELAMEYDRWQSLAEELTKESTSRFGLNNQLRLRRREVLSGRAKKRSQFTLPQMALATAAGITLTVGVALWLQPPPQPRVMDLAALVQADMQDEPDLTANIDFYEWMEKQGDLADL